MMLAFTTAILLSLTLSVSGMDPRRNYAVQTSTDLVAWQTRWNVVGDGTEKCFMVDGSGTPFFYRVVTMSRARPPRPPAPR